jgi:ketosteroid isomerase-like protein
VADEPLTIARAGFDAWRRGDFDAVEQMLDPAVQWRWFEPGDWDCHDRDQVMRTLRQRHAHGFAEGRIELRPGGEDSVIVVAYPSEVGGPEWPAETATIIRFRGGKVVSMQDYRTEREAIDAVAAV